MSAKCQWCQAKSTVVCTKISDMDQCAFYKSAPVSCPDDRARRIENLESLLQEVLDYNEGNGKYRQLGDIADPEWRDNATFDAWQDIKWAIKAALVPAPVLESAATTQSYCAADLKPPTEALATSQRKETPIPTSEDLKEVKE